MQILMEQDVYYLINHFWAHPWLDVLMAALSSWAFWWPFALLAGLATLAFGGFHARVMLLVIGISVGITDGVVVRSLKDLVGRPRPHEVLVGARTLDLAKARPRFLALGKPLKVRYSQPQTPALRGKSFPSGHAANNFAIATVVFLFYRRWGWLAYFPAAVVAYSRIYVGVHWPLDVLVACFLGTGIAFLATVGLEACWRRWGPRVLPSLFAAHPSLTRP